MTKKEIMKLQSRNREIQSRLREIYTKMETEKRDEYSAEEKREVSELNNELEANRREILLSKDEAAIAEMREQIDRNKQYREYLQGVRQKREDATTTLAPKSPADGSSITESGAIVLNIQDIIDTKENGLGRPVGQSFVTGVEGDELYPYSINDVEMEEVGEIEAINGVVCAWGKKTGVPTPVNDWIVRTVQAIQDGRLTPGPQNLSRLP